MQLNSKKELRLLRVAQALKVNLKKRKIFQNKTNKEGKKIKLKKNSIISLKDFFKYCH